jgi:hypothetical protein
MQNSITVFLIDTPLADIPNPQLFQNKIFIKKEGNTYPMSSCKMHYWSSFQSSSFLSTWPLMDVTSTCKSSSIKRKKKKEKRKKKNRKGVLY